MSETKGRNHEDTNRGCRPSIAFHPDYRMKVNGPCTPSQATAVSATPGLSLDNRRAPSCEGIRSCVASHAGLLMASAHLPRNTKNRKAMEFINPTWEDQNLALGVCAACCQPSAAARNHRQRKRRIRSSPHLNVAHGRPPQGVFLRTAIHRVGGKVSVESA